MYAHLADFLLAVEHRPDTDNLVYVPGGRAVAKCTVCDFVSTEPQSGLRLLINAFVREHSIRDYGTNALDMCYA